MNRWLRRLFLGIAFALPLALVSFALVQTPVEAQSGNSDLDCALCHFAVEEIWSDGAHGQASTDPIFLDAWRAGGEDETCLNCHTTGYDSKTGLWEKDGVGCESCHDSEGIDHPTEPIPADRSAAFCGTCHTETYFEWQVSGHGSEDLDCLGCHDPHQTGLKTYDASTLCSTCHQTRASSFGHSEHAAEGLTCADCHLGTTSTEIGEGRGVRDHSFGVKLSTCTECHADQMHDPVDVQTEPLTAPEPEPVSGVDTLTMSVDPSPISPVGFAMLSGIVGMASGMILAPWLERWYERIKKDEE
ncbi:MAG: cytochrome c3 family protein [Anaerolineales bacterium]